MVSPEEAALPITMQITPHQLELDEDGVKIQMTIIDTPGFGDNINNEDAFKDILGYVERQYDEILIEETRIKRNPKFQGIFRIHRRGLMVD